MSAYFKEEVKPWEGGILTTVVNTFENMDGKGHGAKLECLSMMVSCLHPTISIKPAALVSFFLLLLLPLLIVIRLKPLYSPAMLSNSSTGTPA